jgi:hypothetical protein
MKKSLKTIVWIAILTLLLSACNLGVSGPTPDAAGTLNPLYTAAAQTLEAMSDQGAATATYIVPTSTPVVEDFLTATPTLSFATATKYISPIPVKRCDAAAFVKDVTVSDGTIIRPGSSFTKTWRLQNVGTCSWTSSYELVFVSGDAMSAPNRVSLSGNVKPGETADISVNLKAPGKKGEYRSYWKLRNATGLLFGIGTQADTAFWVDIDVLGPEYVAYDFAANACNAVWESHSGILPCPGPKDDNDGFVRILSDPRMEDGTKEDRPGLLTGPNDTRNGYIQGRYPVFKVQDGDRFLADINCQYQAYTCDVLFQLEYQIGNGSVKTLKEWHEIYEGKSYSVDIDLSFLEGENVKFYLSVSANSSKGTDRALWLAPRIIRQGTRPPTATMTATPTMTATATETETPTETPTETTTP